MLKIVERLMREGDTRSGRVGADLCDGDALALLRGWLDAMALGIDEATLLRMLQDGELSHADLQRRARRIHERRLGKAVGDAGQLGPGGPTGHPAPQSSAVRRLPAGDSIRRLGRVPGPREAEADAL